jgi:hypothetical protein
VTENTIYVYGTPGQLLTTLSIPGKGWTSRLKESVERQSFTARKTWTQQHGDDLNYGKEFQLQFLRKGIVGDWHNHDWTNCYDLAMEHWKPMMEKLGYE